jgi:hypothetical protein
MRGSVPLLSRGLKAAVDPSRQLRAGKRCSLDLPRSSPAACRQTDLEDRPRKPYTADCLHSLGTFYSASGSLFLVGLMMVAVIALFQPGTALRRWQHTIQALRNLSSGPFLSMDRRPAEPSAAPIIYARTTPAANSSRTPPSRPRPRLVAVGRRAIVMMPEGQPP